MNLPEISERLRTQDNRCTADPMFCMQIKVRDVGYYSGLVDNHCWRTEDAESDTLYDGDPGFAVPEGEEWDCYGYVDRWETVMVAFTERGCQEFLELDGHNVRARAFRGEVRIYAESFRRCPEMLAIRAALLAGGAL